MHTWSVNSQWVSQHYSHMIMGLVQSDMQLCQSLSQVVVVRLFLQSIQPDPLELVAVQNCSVVLHIHNLKFWNWRRKHEGDVFQNALHMSKYKMSSFQPKIKCLSFGQKWISFHLARNNMLVVWSENEKKYLFGIVWPTRQNNAYSSFFGLIPLQLLLYPVLW